MLVRWSQSYFVAMLLGVGLIASSCAEGGVDPLASPCDPGDTECVDTKPSNSGSGESLCGNGMPDPGEECDSDNVGRRSCEEQGLVGQVSCDANCRIDFSTCTMPEVDPCGNGQLDAGEDCDGANLNGMTCVSLGAGFVSGDLACGADCSFDSSRCVFQVVDPCGNGRLDMGETCDDLNQIGGDGCDDFCQVEDNWECMNEPSECRKKCGNGKVDIGEQCDDGNYIDDDGCDRICTVEPGFSCAGDPSVCQEKCGDGRRDLGELCDDGNSTNGDGCSDSCMPEPGYSCTGDPSRCERTCGNSTVNSGENCDDGNLVNGDGCSSSCMVEPGFVCSGAPSSCQELCGDGVVEPSEDCDGANLDGQSCESIGMGFTGGTLGCSSTCELIISGCTTSMCGNGQIESGEVCDGSNFNGQSCQSMGFDSGSLSCNGCASIDTSGCSNNTPSCMAQGCDTDFQTALSCSTAYGPGRTNIAAPGARVPGFTLDTLPDDDNAIGCFDEGDEEFFYVYLIAGETLELTVRDAESDFDSVLKVYDDQMCASGGTPVECVDAGFDGDNETVTFTATITGFHTIVVDGAFSSDAGTYNLDMVLTCGPQGCCCSP